MSQLPNDFALSNLSNLSRRGFLKGVGATSALVLAASWGWQDALADEKVKLFGADGMPNGWIDDPKVYVSIAADGTVTVDLDVVDGSLYALGLDDFGIPFSPGLAVEVGRRIRPSVFTGVLYQVTEPGVLPATEPVWWPITSEGSRELGTARAEAVRYYRPLAHGPVTAEPS